MKRTRSLAASRAAAAPAAQFTVPPAGSYPLKHFLAVVRARRFLEQEAAIIAARPVRLRCCPACGNTTQDVGEIFCAACRKRHVDQVSA